MGLLEKSGEKDREAPYTSSREEYCVFYDLFAIGNTLIYCEGSGLCALKNDLCQMQLEKPEPNWDGCSLTEEKRKYIEEKSENTWVFADKLHLFNKKYWPGIPLLDWEKYISNNGRG